MSWFPVKRLLVPVDFSEMSLQAVEVGLSLVDDAAHLHIIYVAPEVVTGDPGFGWKPLEALTRKGQIAKALQETLCESRHQGIKVDVAFGDPGTEIARYAEEHNVELIVMPSHGRTGVKHLLVGSVAERVLRLAHCPVLILRN